MSHATLAEANVYFSTRLHTEAWDALTDAVIKQKALDHGTSIIDNLPFDTTVYDISDTTTLQRVKDANCEIAIALLDGIDPDLAIANLTVTNNSIAGVRTSHDIRFPAEHILYGVPSIAAWRILRCYIKDGRSVTITKV